MPLPQKGSYLIWTTSSTSRGVIPWTNKKEGLLLDEIDALGLDIVGFYKYYENRYVMAELLATGSA